MLLVQLPKILDLPLAPLYALAEMLFYTEHEMDRHVPFPFHLSTFLPFSTS